MKMLFKSPEMRRHLILYSKLSQGGSSLSLEGAYPSAGGKLKPKGRKASLELTGGDSNINLRRRRTKESL